MNLDPLAELMRRHSPDGMDPIDPRTGKPYKINLWRDGIVSINESRNTPDTKLLSRVDWRPLGIPHKRDRGVSDGGRETTFIHETTNSKLSDGAKIGLAEITGLDSYSSTPAPVDGWWERAAKSGSYIFSDSAYAESEVFQVDNKFFNVVEVEDNIVSQITNLTLNSNNEFDIKSVTSFSTKKGEIKTRVKKSYLGGLIKTTEKYRELTVTETVQNYKDNKIHGDSVSKTYKKEQIIEE